MILSISALWLIPCFALGTCFGVAIIALLQMNRISEMDLYDKDQEAEIGLYPRYTRLNKPFNEKEIAG